MHLWKAKLSVLIGKRKSGVLLTVLMAFTLSITLLPASGYAASPKKILQDCLDGALDGHYSSGDLNNALDNLPADIDEYSDCRSVINDGLLSTAAGDSSSDNKLLPAAYNGDSPVVIQVSPEDAAAIVSAQKNGNQPIKIDGEEVVPGASGFSPGALTNKLPAPLSALLILTTVVLILSTSMATVRRIRIRRG